mgnify:CR=1 FL=1
MSENRDSIVEKLDVLKLQYGLAQRGDNMYGSLAELLSEATQDYADYLEDALGEDVDKEKILPILSRFAGGLYRLIQDYLWQGGIFTE